MFKEEFYFDKSRIDVRRISRDVAKKFVEKNHYSHKLSLCRIAYGVFYKEDDDSKFFKDEKKEKLIGCIVYSQPAGRSASESISPSIKKGEALELIRLCCLEGYGKNLESYVIGQSFKLLKKDFPKIKALISYADPEQNHRGGIYISTNWYYQGCGSVGLMPNYSLSLTKNPYNWMHSRTCSERFGSHNVEHLKNVIGHTFYRKMETQKHRYFYLICDKKTKKQILKTLVHKTQEYPKNNVYVENIEKVVVEENINKDCKFF